MRKHSECRAKDPATCRHHGRLSTTTKEDFMTSFITTNVNKLVHLTDDEKLYLTSELKASMLSLALTITITAKSLLL
jgi:hypothetical protein